MALWTLYKRELSTYFHSAVAYIVLCGSALAQGIIFFVLVWMINSYQVRTFSVMQLFFTSPLFFWLLLVVQVPLITMRVFSEEFKLGTIEMLLTAPVNEWDVVLAKFFGALTFYVLLWVPIALNLTCLETFTSPPPPLIWSENALTALTVFLVGCFYVSIGVFTSVLTKNQIISAVLCFALMFLTFGIALIKYMPGLDYSFVTYLSTPEHIESAVHGVFDSRPVVFYLSFTAAFLILTQRVLQARRLKG